MNGENERYLRDHSLELSRRYAGKIVAVVDGELAAVADNRVEAYKEARERFPAGKVCFDYFPTEKERNLLL